MHLNAQRPCLMPREFFREFEKLSKAALLDIAWDYATRSVGEDKPETEIAGELRGTATTITRHRAQARRNPAEA